MAERIVSDSRNEAPDATADEIAEVAKAEAKRIDERAKHGLKVVNPIGLLIHSVRQRFQGPGLARLRAATAVRTAEERQRQDRERQCQEQQAAEARAFLDNPNASAFDQVWARHVLGLPFEEVA